MFLQHLAAVARFSGNGAHFTPFATQEMVDTFIFQHGNAYHIYIMLCSHRRSDQLDQARSSYRVPV
jgi:hypothetical protein